MKIRDILRFEKENMPDFQWKFEKFLFFYIVVLIGGGLLALISGLIIGFAVNEEGIYCFIPEFVWFAVLAAATVLLVVKSKKVKIGLCSYYYDKLSSEFYTLDFSEAKSNLANDNIINDVGFIVDGDLSIEDGVIPFVQAKFVFNPYIWAGKIFLSIDGLPIDELDNNLYNFFRNNRDMIVNRKIFDLFCDDLITFVDMLVRYNSIAKIEKKLN